MLNILVPMAGCNQYFPEADFPFPKSLVEIFGVTMIERVINNLKTSSPTTNFTFVLNENDCRNFFLDNIVDIITDSNCNIVKLDSNTRGSACSALMAVNYIEGETPLLIANSDQLFKNNISEFIKNFEYQNADAGVVCFDSVHPRWSYAKVDNDKIVIEAAEKRPISRNAIAGLYWFKKGDHFIDAAMKMIQKNENYKDDFFIAPSLNQMILDGKKIVMSEVQNACYNTFYMPSKITEYEQNFSPNQLSD